MKMSQLHWKQTVQKRLLWVACSFLHPRETSASGFVDSSHLEWWLLGTVRSRNVFFLLSPAKRANTYYLLVLERMPSRKRAYGRCWCYYQSVTGTWSVLDYNYDKLFLLRAYIASHKFDVICLSETYLDSTVASNDENLEITGYNQVRSNHPANTKRGEVCLYYKTCLPLRVLEIQYVNECINFELKIGDKLRTLVALYRSPSQSQDKFETFIYNFELNLETLSRKNPFLLVAISDFNVKSKFWCCIDNTTSQGKTLENVT